MAVGPRYHSTSAASDNNNSIIFEKDHSVHIVSLNRPRALNALSSEILEAFSAKLKEITATAEIPVVVVRSTTERALCAGGDVKAVVGLLDARDHDGFQHFFRVEYELVHALATGRLVQVSLLDGITMGGGVGLTCHGALRIATERSVWAMPETAIGLFPDVGGAFILSRLDGALGEYLGLTGASLDGAEMVALGIATNYVRHDSLPGLVAAIGTVPDPCLVSVYEQVEHFSAMPEELVAAPRPGSVVFDKTLRRYVDTVFALPSVADIVDALRRTAAGDENEELRAFAARTVERLAGCSPLSLHVTLRYVRAARDMDLAGVIQKDWHLVNNLGRFSDFSEGVRSKLVRKDAGPTRWGSAGMSEKEMDMFYENNTSLADIELGKTYVRSPYAELSFPRESDLRMVIQSNNFESADEVAAWFSANWPTMERVTRQMSTLKGMWSNEPKKRFGGESVSEAKGESELEFSIAAMSMLTGSQKTYLQEYVKWMLKDNVTKKNGYLTFMNGPTSSFTESRI